MTLHLVPTYAELAYLEAVQAPWTPPEDLPVIRLDPNDWYLEG